MQSRNIFHDNSENTDVDADVGDDRAAAFSIEVKP